MYRPHRIVGLRGQNDEPRERVAFSENAAQIGAVAVGKPETVFRFVRRPFKEARAGHRTAAQAERGGEGGLLPHRLAARVDERPSLSRKAPLCDHQSGRRQNRRVLTGENFPHMPRHAGKIPRQPVCDVSGEAVAAVAVVCKCVSSAHIQFFPSTNHCG